MILKITELVIMSKKAIVLGGTNPHIALIKSLKKRGYHVILIDYLNNPPAKKFADKHIKASTLDLEKVLEIAKKNSPELVISTSIDQANLTACYVSEKLNLSIPYSFKIALEVTDKAIMKRKLYENKIPTANYQTIKDINDFEINEFNFPLIVKPADSNGSNGVRKAENLDDLNEFFAIAKNISRNNKVIIEEFISGKEYSADFFIRNGNAELLLIRRNLPLVQLIEILYFNHLVHFLRRFYLMKLLSK